MANRSYVEVEESEGMWDVKVFDDYDTGNIVLFEKPPDDDVELLTIVVERVREDKYSSPQAERAGAIIDHIMECHKGMYIRDTYYSAEELAPAFA